MTTFKRSKKQGWHQVTLTPLQEAQIRVQQLTNDLTAAKVREEMHRADELKLIDRINGLQNHQKTLDTALNSVMKERDDWRDAFRTVAKLVK